MGLREQFTGWKPALWAGWRPNGLGEQKPDHYRDMVRVAWANRAHPRYAWQVLTRGACDGCALGVAGLHDWTIDGIHLCTTRLNLLELNTADAVDPLVLSDVAALSGHSGGRLRALGRLGHPMRRRRGEPGFRRVSWDEALGVLAGRLRATDPERVALYLTSRGITNETYYAAAKAARAIGVASVDSAARVCHAPSTVGLRQTVGVAATTCSFQDVIEAPLVVLWGSNPANNQPVFMKYLYLARKRGCRVVVVNPYLEPGLDRYWVPSNVESALFGTRMCDLHVPVRPGGDVALANAVLEVLAARGGVDAGFVAAHTTGWDDLAARLAGQDFDDLLARAGVDRATVDAFVDELMRAGGAIHTWSMGITHHRDSADSVRAIVNLALAQGGVGRNGVGLMPIRGHSGVQGGAEMGAYATALPGGLPVDPAGAAALARRLGLPGAGPAGPHRAGDGRGRRAGRPRRPVDVGGQLPRRDARPAGRPGGAGAGAAAGPPGHRDHEPDAGRGGRRRAPPGDHPLRAGGRRHRDHHRAPHRVQSRAAPPGGRGPQRVAAVRRRRQPGPAGPAVGVLVADQPRPPRRDRPGRSFLRGHRGPGRHRRRGPVGRPPPVRRRRVPDPATAGAGSARSTRPTGRCRPGRSWCRPGGASSSTRWSTAPSTR